MSPKRDWSSKRVKASVALLAPMFLLNILLCEFLATAILCYTRYVIPGARYYTWKSSIPQRLIVFFDSNIPVPALVTTCKTFYLYYRITYKMSRNISHRMPSVLGTKGGAGRKNYISNPADYCRKEERTVRNFGLKIIAAGRRDLLAPGLRPSHSAKKNKIILVYSGNHEAIAFRGVRFRSLLSLWRWALESR